MSGIFFLAVIGLWLWVCGTAARALMKRITVTPWRWLAGVGVFAVLFIAPVSDEIVGGFQFRALCKRDAVLTIDSAKVRGRTLRRTASQSSPHDTVLRIEQWRESFVDATSGEELASYSWLRVSGGWFIRALGISEGNAPLVISPADCDPVRVRLDKAYEFTLINN
jgi:hypothetical protein